MAHHVRRCWRDCGCFAILAMGLAFSNGVHANVRTRDSTSGRVWNVTIVGSHCVTIQSNGAVAHNASNRPVVGDIYRGYLAFNAAAVNAPTLAARLDAITEQLNRATRSLAAYAESFASRSYALDSHSAHRTYAENVARLSSELELLTLVQHVAEEASKVRMLEASAMAEYHYQVALMNGLRDARNFDVRTREGLRRDIVQHHLSTLQFFNQASACAQRMGHQLLAGYYAEEARTWFAESGRAFEMMLQIARDARLQETPQAYLADEAKVSELLHLYALGGNSSRVRYLMDHLDEFWGSSSPDRNHMLRFHVLRFLAEEANALLNEQPLFAMTLSNLVRDLSHHYESSVPSNAELPELDLRVPRYIH